MKIEISTKLLNDDGSPVAEGGTPALNDRILLNCDGFVQAAFMRQEVVNFAWKLNLDKKVV